MVTRNSKVHVGRNTHRVSTSHPAAYKRRRLNLELLERRALLAASLLADIQQLPVGSQPHNLAEVNGTLYFAAKDDVYGIELWKTDGTAASTKLVKDIYPGIGSSKPHALTNVNGTLFFVAHDGVNGFELWKSDGTESGTVMVRDIRPGPDSSVNPESLLAECDLVFQMVAHNGRAYFPATDGVTGPELWSSDGTAAGTVLEGDVNPGMFGSCPAELTSVGSRVFYAATGPDGRELYAATTSGVELVQDIQAGPGSSNPARLTSHKGTLYFAADDGSRGVELWKSDGNGAELVRDIYPGPAGSYPDQLASSGEDLLFSADDGTSGAELWHSEGTRDSTNLVKDIEPGLGSSVPSELTDVDGQLFFSAFDSDRGDELWTSFMGTDEFGQPKRFTELVKDIAPGRWEFVAKSSSPADLTSAAGALFFFADDDVSGGELWVSYVTQCPGPQPQRVTTQVRDIRPGPDGSYPSAGPFAGSYMTAMGRWVYFAANDGTVELWRATAYFGGPPPTCPDVVAEQVIDLNDLDTSNSDPGGFVGRAINNGAEVYYTADDGVRGRELWRSFRSTTGSTQTELVADLRPGPVGSSPSYLAFARDASTGRDTLYFGAFAPATGVGLWKLDNQGQPVLVKADVIPSGMTNVNGRLYFGATGVAAGTTGLWKSDGTETGTVLVEGFSAAPIQLVAIGNTVFFEASDGRSGYEVWRSDGTTGGTTLVADINPGPNSSWPHDLTGAGGQLFFGADDGTSGDELYQYDPSMRRLNRISINPGPDGSFPSDLTHVVGPYAPPGVLFFSAENGTTGRELHVLDLSGGANPNGLVRDIVPGPGSSFPIELTHSSGRLFFTANDVQRGYELWQAHVEVDPITKAPMLVTELVRDIHLGPLSSLPIRLTDVDGTLFFSANNGNDGDELWISDGSADGTVLFADVNPGAAGSSIPEAISVGGTLFFAANDGTHGMEPWVATRTTRVPGDANGDGRFNSSDLVLVFQAGEYEDGVPGNSAFEEGDWDGDGDFTTADLVLAFQTGTYEAAAAQPSPILSTAVDAIFGGGPLPTRGRVPSPPANGADADPLAIDGLLGALPVRYRARSARDFAS